MENLIKNTNKKVKSRNKNIWVYVFFFSMVVGGLATGYLLAPKGERALAEVEKGKIVKTDKVVGSLDTKTFKDDATGVLEKGGIDGEGTHHLVRKGGPSQNAYLTSSYVDLNQFVGKKVKVWGETFKAEKAGWLMDVGRVEIKE